MPADSTGLISIFYLTAVSKNVKMTSYSLITSLKLVMNYYDIIHSQIGNVFKNGLPELYCPITLVQCYN